MSITQLPGRVVNVVVKGNGGPQEHMEFNTDSITNEHTNVLAAVCQNNLIQDSSWIHLQALPRPEHAVLKNMQFDVNIDEKLFLQKNEPVSDNILFNLEMQFLNRNLVWPPDEFISYIEKLETEFSK